MEYCFDLLNTAALIDLDQTFCLYWETQLAGPDGASAWSGASLHTTTSVTGAQTVPISAQKITPMLSAALELTKTVSETLANPGDTITYTFVVTNTGNYAYSDVVITDPLFGAGWSHSVGSLAVGSSKTYTASYTIPSGTAPGPFVNTAAAAGTYSGGSKTAVDDETLVIQTVTADSPSINIHKTVNPVDAEPGDTVTYSFHVTNTGNVDLQNVVVTDPMFSSWSHVIATLHAGEIVWIDKQYTVPRDAATGLILNTVSVTGAYPGGQVSDMADASLNIASDNPPALTAGIELTKRAAGETVNPGDTITYHFTVKNTGTYPLTTITVTDVLFGSGWSYLIEQMAPGASVSFDHTYPVAPDHTPGIIENTAAVSATYTGGTVSDTTSETVSVIAIPPVGQASLHIDKTADRETAVPGETIAYSIHVTNDGDADLSNVILTDHLMGDGWTYNFGTLHVGETKDYHYTYTVPEGTLAGELTNTAIVSGFDGDEAVNGSDDAIVFIDAPPPEITHLILTSVCTENPELSRRWKITNENHTDIAFSWVLMETGEAGSGIARGDTDMYLELLALTGLNTLKITYQGDMEETRVSSGLQCPPENMQLVTIHSMCASGPEGSQVEWQIYNPNDYNINATWESENRTGIMTLHPGISILYTDDIQGSPNTLTLYINGEKYAVVPSACYKDVHLEAVCSESPLESLRWRLTNDNDYPVDVSWVLYNASPVQSGTVTVQPGATYFYTDTIPGDNIVAVFVDDVLQRNGTVLSLKLQCPAGEIEAETAVLGEKEVDLGDTVEPSMPDGTILIQDVLGATDELPQTGGIYLWQIYLPGFALIALGAVLWIINRNKKARVAQ